MDASGVTSSNFVEISEVLFFSESVVVKHVGFGGKDCVITFSSFNGSRKFGFGEGFFTKRGLSAIHFIAQSDHWWNTSDMEAAIEHVRSFQRSGMYHRFVTYGSSMGAYGAAAFSGPLDADSCILFAPQYSMNPNMPPFESRWKTDTVGLPPFVEIRDNISTTAKKFVFVDMGHPDALHARLYAQIPNTELIHVGLSGHHPMRKLQNVGVLSQCIVDIIRDRFEVPEFIRKFRLKRIFFAYAWIEAGLLLSKHKKPRLALNYVNRAVALNSKNAAAHNSRAIILASKDPSEALHASRTACELDPNSADAWSTRFELAKRAKLDREALEAGMNLMHCSKFRYDLTRRVLIYIASTASALNPKEQRLTEILALLLG